MTAIDASSRAVTVAPLLSQGVDQVFLVAVTTLVYDFLINLDNEFDYLLNSRATWTKALFVACRYIPFVLCALHVPMAFQWSLEACPILAESTLLFLAILSFSAECVFALRTHALWNCNRRIRTALLVPILAFLCSLIILVVASGVATKTSNFTPGCNSTTSIPAGLILSPYGLLLLLEAEVLCLTTYRMIKYYYTTRSRLLTSITQYSIGYVLAGLCFTITNIIAISFLSGEYGPVLESMQVMAQALLATRMQLDLWKLDRHLVTPTSDLTGLSLTSPEVYELSQRTVPSAPSGPSVAV